MNYLPAASRRLRQAMVTTSLTLGLVAAGTLPAGAQPLTDDQSKPTRSSATTDRLGKHDRDLLARARAKQQKTVSVIVMSNEGDTSKVTAELSKLGGRITKTMAKVGYVRATVPTSSVEKAAALPGVAALDLNESIPLPKTDPDTARDAVTRGSMRVATPGRATPAANAFLPTNETGSVAFKADHPGWDGRGVTIGILDSGISLDNPALQRTTTGERKIVDWVTATDPAVDGDNTWRPMTRKVSGPSFKYNKQTWVAPAGRYLFNTLAESVTLIDQLEGDVNRDGDTSDQWGILYDPVTNDIRVDVNQNRDFTDDAVMRPYKEKFDVGHFGVDDPKTPVRDQVPFVVEFRKGVHLNPVGLAVLAAGAIPDQAVDFVNIGIPQDEHGSHVAGIAAGNDLFGNRQFDGQAPGAKLVSARACNWGGGCTYAALTDGLVDLVFNRHVDVVNISIGGLPAFNDGSNARAELYNRVINDLGVQLFISAGNSGPGLNTVGDPSVASDAVSVAASVSKASWLANYGSVVRKERNLFPFSSRGPREDGGFKPDIVAPGSAISTIDSWLPGSPVAQAGYNLPPGYAMLNGTSMASPQATGVGALLISAFRAQDRAVTPAQLRGALYSGARFETGIPAAGQGHGFIDVNAAWRLLEGSPQTRTYLSSAPVCTVMSGYLSKPGRGTGIFNNCASSNGGPAVGSDKTYKVTITRMSGPTGQVKHDIRWHGNDGTFGSPSSVVLPLRKPVVVVVHAKPRVGAHSAVMQVDDPKTELVDYSMMNTVVAAASVTKAPYRFQARASVDRNSTTSYFIDVPAGARTLQVNLSGLATGSQVRWMAIDPQGVPVEESSSLVCYANYSDPAGCDPFSRAYNDPLPGVWELEVEARRTSLSLDNPYQLSARIQAVTVQPETVELPSVVAGQPVPVQWTVRNEFGTATMAARGGPLGSLSKQRPELGPGQIQRFTVVVPDGATRLDASVGNPSDPGADLDLFVNKDGERVAESAGGDSNEAVALTDPAPGTYEVLVVGYAVPGGSTAYDYSDAFYSPGLGVLAVVPAEPFTLTHGGTKTVHGTLVAQAAATDGRRIVGEMTVVTDSGAVLGHGFVQVGAVD